MAELTWLAVVPNPLTSRLEPITDAAGARREWRAETRAEAERLARAAGIPAAAWVVSLVSFDAMQREPARLVPKPAPAAARPVMRRLRCRHRACRRWFLTRWPDSRFCPKCRAAAKGVQNRRLPSRPLDRPDPEAA